MKTLFWFRRDLRIDDNKALYYAIKESTIIEVIFIFDPSILSKLTNPSDRRVSFIFEQLHSIQKVLSEHQIPLTTQFGLPAQIIPSLLSSGNYDALYFNEDFEPETRERDKLIAAFCKKNNILLKSFCDHIIFHPHEILKKDQKPYTVFTPYSHAWKEKLRALEFDNFPSAQLLSEKFPRQTGARMTELDYPHGFKYSPTFISIPAMGKWKNLLLSYSTQRDLPAMEGTTHIGIHLRMGTISIREAVKLGVQWSETWLNELIWREFFIQILYFFPEVQQHCFHKKYDNIPWDNNEEKFVAWCEGRTGVPLVDAGMRELLSTGFMHNRVRMNVASFLSKNLLIDWRWGEAFFFQHLLDYELASNNGNWQWAAGTGVDAAPYFRIFNPFLQAKKFDPDNIYIKKWIPELETKEYPNPIIDIQQSRVRCLSAYKSVNNVNQ